ncbi:MAG: hypothetical protein Q4Q07_00685 [Tissierellia bacterium]|nr:hypothetical protein [Tissierellia bacterium]
MEHIKYRERGLLKYHLKETLKKSLYLILFIIIFVIYGFITNFVSEYLFGFNEKMKIHFDGFEFLSGTSIFFLGILQAKYFNYELQIGLKRKDMVLRAILLGGILSLLYALILPGIYIIFQHLPTYYQFNFGPFHDLYFQSVGLHTFFWLVVEMFFYFTIGLFLYTLSMRFRKEFIIGGVFICFFIFSMNSFYKNHWFLHYILGMTSLGVEPLRPMLSLCILSLILWRISGIIVKRMDW